jgi:hypothetical protein
MQEAARAEGVVLTSSADDPPSLSLLSGSGAACLGIFLLLAEGLVEDTTVVCFFAMIVDVDGWELKLRGGVWGGEEGGMSV